MRPVDEGMIHAWLDGALSAAEAARIEQLVASDAAWSAAAAEARGLIAASTRILSSLDAVPAKVLPPSMATTSAARDELHMAKAEPPRARRVRPQVWALAATLMMAVGAGVLWKDTPADDITLAKPVVAANDMPERAASPAVGYAAPAAAGAVSAAGTKTTSRDARLPTSVAAGASERAGIASSELRAERAAQPALTARVPAAEPSASVRSVPSAPKELADGPAEAKKKSEDVGARDASMRDASTRERADAGRAVAAAPSAIAPAASAAGALGGAGAASPAQGAGSAAALDARAANGMKASAKTLAEAAPGRRAVDAATPVIAAPACWTVRLNEWTPPPSFPVPVGVLLDSLQVGTAQVARALVGSNAPVPAPGQWHVSGDTTRVLIDRVVLGYALRATVLTSTLKGQATLGEAGAPVKSSATAVMQPSRCPAP